MERNEAIEKVFKENANRIMYTIRKTGCKEQDVEDILHQTMIQALINYEQLKDKSKIVPWCVTIAINIALKKLKKDSHLQVIDFTDEEEVAKISEDGGYNISTEDMEDADTRMDIKNLLNRLAPGYSLPLTMSVVFGFAYAEIAEILGIKEGTVKSRINRAKKMIEKLVQNDKASKSGTEKKVKKISVKAKEIPKSKMGDGNNDE